MKTHSRMLLGWDLAGGALAAAAAAILVHGNVSSAFAKDVYELGSAVLAIVFSVYLAALAIVTSSSDDEFIRFLEEEDLFSQILWGFKITLWLLFVALISGAGLFLWTAHAVANSVPTQHEVVFVLFVFMFAWSLLAAMSSTNASVKYAQLRVRFLKVSRKSEEPR